MTDRDRTLASVKALIEPFNKKGIEVTEATRFAQDLEWDSLTVLDFVANMISLLFVRSVGHEGREVGLRVE